MVFQIYFPLLTLLFFTLNVTALPDEQNPADLLSTLIDFVLRNLLGLSKKR